ncbi:aldehyde dehydrogenase family protein [Yaniella flava]|uniref:Aldehyde dehydrogenase family protein n=1 Tax=Yaniella flava TaxID=287930 RepID=A0ABN2UXP2_9MICC
MSAKGSSHQKHLFATASAEVKTYNPSKPRQVVTQLQESTNSDVSRATDRAHLAQVEWKESSPAVRSDLLMNIGNTLNANEEQLADLMVDEVGKTRQDALGEVKNAAAVFRFYAGRVWNPTGKKIPSFRPGVSLSTERFPLGVVGLITPWNFPVNMLSVKLAPALAWGNGAVVKPASAGLGSSLFLIDLLYEAGLPEGLVTSVIGPGDRVGGALIASQVISGVSFTGSTDVGTQIAQKMAATGRPFLGEMGGKNASVVLESADLDNAVDTIVQSAFGFSGQKCTATSRVIVQENVEKEFTDRLLQAVQQITFGDPQEQTSYAGPIATRGQYEKIAGSVNSAVKKGQDVLPRWKLPEEPDVDGFYIQPAVLTDVSADDEVFQEEIFGPVVSVTTAKDINEAISFVNNSRFGLSASLFTQDPLEAQQFQQEAEVGVVNINLPTTGLEYQAPYGGWKMSGTSHQELGDEAMLFYTQAKSFATKW